MTYKEQDNNERIIDFKTAPLVPIRNVIIFPNIVQPLTVGRPRSINAIEAALRKDRFVVVSTQKNEFVEDPGPSDMYPVGVGAEVLQVIRLPDSTLRVIIEGFTRVRVKRFIDMEQRYEVDVDTLSTTLHEGPYIQALSRELIDSFEQYFQLNKRMSPENYVDLVNIRDLDRLTDLISSAVILNVEEKQSLLEILDIKERLHKLLELIKREVSVLQLQGQIESEVKNKFDKTQKEYYLREQLRAIQKELGDSESEYTEEVKKYREKMESLELPEDIKKVVEDELTRLMKMPPMMAEAGVVRNYIEWVLALPWNKETPDALDLQLAKEMLDEDHYGLQDVKERILEYLAVRKLSEKIKAPILCLVGPPGVGKTSLGKSVARAMGRKFIRMSLGGIRDEAEIRGHRRTYVGALPGRIIQGMKEAATKNPIFLLDEIDKIGTDFRGDPSSALLEALDPEQNFAFSDHFLEVPFDLSKVFFITTANVSHTIPAALKDRMEFINLSGYTEDEKFNIAKNFIIKKQLAANGLKDTDISMPDETIRSIINQYTSEAGLRNLERQIAKVFRKVAFSKASKLSKFRKMTIKKDKLMDYLKAPVFRHEVAGVEYDPGMVTGLSVTQVGGEILFIEAIKMPGKGNLILTGQLGEVMKESATAAMSYIRSRADQINLNPDFQEKIDIHIHVPEGAIPKDGPSAGIALFSAICSLLLGKKIAADIAMTGEITLKGRVLPIGGLKDKLLAAHRAGIKQVIIPKDNEKDIIYIDQEIISKLKIHFVSHLDEVFDLLLRKE
jgi:ATP-dependent Lon protease